MLTRGRIESHVGLIMQHNAVAAEVVPNIHSILRHIIGATMMGIGGILALGCTIGQGLSGMSTLALGSLISLISIITGGAFGIKYLEEGNLQDAFKALFSSS